ncbi:argininosuccinate lyase [Clostridium botulinum]|uniref:Argininosuccinate lyase n=1 Tax=Clostridium botulinum (strain Langeland / NCTC 10281 / Type F) TaxID=441772 RepID=ARLY_CLOBL|nr:argininosuccinate lyase [Clostridium botulinum]A7GGQ8.1 RecName: Full=Argininosuccinate lyase; Short=ASAL; AltName: Full=Arginosuccinase [Clostridium botulinum F str. Langeland]ABS42428.1 argininosuccinate lyase [Clostridium botulinum F str. Langeland]ADG00362.1 argininosuccinate lyase [Clostridium botulinum F str. 230613]KKM41147.1 argininosuccinate lyase [Clostridium botulinum]MBD5644747.1 argininosuccinate lyase [Clostridium botulinum]MBY6793824.1 argininosuccinate lyase [Clostridium bo
MKLWGGRFKEEESKLMEDFNSSLSFDKKLYYEDIKGSIAHVKMLVNQNIIKEEEKEKILLGLEEILKEIDEGILKIEGDYEDIHSFVEINLINKIGNVGKKLHTGRSRNDQVALDMKLYAKKSTEEVIKCLKELMDSLIKVGNENNYIMPGYTHLQRAQVVTFRYHLLAYFEMFKRDEKRLKNALEILNESPLGSGALAGSTYSIDREYTAKLLGFRKPVDNFLDGVSDRDYIIELISKFSIIMMHLSRLSEELILWSSSEFRFIQIGDAYSTGSSIMPQKKNPDGAELIRGKTGRVYGDLIGILTVMKSLPLAYNKDMQEDKEPFFDAKDTVISCLKVMEGIISTLKVNKENLMKSVKKGFLNATEAADYLVNKGMAFRDAHKVIGEIVIYCEDKNSAIEDLSLEELKQFSDLFCEDIYGFIDYKSSINKGIKKEMGYF